jgi:hypothetical protein
MIAGIVVGMGILLAIGIGVGLGFIIDAASRRSPLLGLAVYCVAFCLFCGWIGAGLGY